MAGREKDLEFVRVAASHGLVQERELRARLADTTLVDELRRAVSVRITRAFAS